MQTAAGIVEDSRTYTLAGLAESLGYRQTRSVERLLREIECPVVVLGNKKLVSGRQFRLAVEGKLACLPTSNGGH